MQGFGGAQNPTILPTNRTVEMVLPRVMNYLADDERTLFSAVLTNTHWHHEGTGVLWQEPPSHALGEVSSGCGHLYAKHARVLTFDDDVAYLHHTFQDFEFPKLKCFWANNHTEDFDEYPFDQHFQPSLENSPSLFVAGPAEDIPTLVATECPILRCIQFCFQTEGLTPERLIWLFQKCKPLKAISISSTVATYVNDEVLAYLGRYVGLEELRVQTTLTPEIVNRVILSPDGLFRHLRYADLQVHSQSVPQLFAGSRNFPFLTSLNLLFVDTGNEIRDTLSYISNLNRLTELCIICLNQVDWDRVDLLELRWLSNLRELCISPGPILQCLEFTDNDFQSVFRNKAKLQMLRFQVFGKLSVKALNSLATSCPCLETCDIAAMAELDGWHDTLPVFPRLEELMLDAVTYEGYTDIMDEQE